MPITSIVWPLNDSRCPTGFVFGHISCASFWLRIATCGDRSSSCSGEVAARLQRDAHHLEVARRDDVLESLDAGRIPVAADRVFPSAVVQRQRDGVPGRLDPRHRLQAIDELPLEGAAASFRVALTGQVDPRGEDAADMVAGVDRRGILQRLDAESRRDQENHRERDLRHDESAAQPRPGRAAARDVCAFQRRHDIRARRLERRNEAEEKPRCRGAPQREPEDAPVHTEVEIEREEQIPVGEQAAEPAGHPAADDQPADAAGERERQAFREQLPDDAHAARAQRQPGRDLLLAGGGPRQEQPRDIGAGDEQDDRDRGDRHGRKTPELFLDLEVTPQPRLYAGAGLPVGVGILALETRRDSGELRARLSQRRAGREPPEYLGPGGAALAEAHGRRRVGAAQRHDRHPDVARCADPDARVSFLGHADQREVVPVEFD